MWPRMGSMNIQGTKNSYRWVPMISGHGTEKLFSMEIEILGLGVPPAEPMFGHNIRMQLLQWDSTCTSASPQEKFMQTNIIMQHRPTSNPEIKSFTTEITQQSHKTLQSQPIHSCQPQGKQSYLGLKRKTSDNA